MNVVLSSPTTEAVAVSFVKGSECRADRITNNGTRCIEVHYDAAATGTEHEEALRRMAAEVCGLMHADKQECLAIVNPPLSLAELLAFLEGLHLGDYSFDRFKSKPRQHLTTVFVVSEALTQQVLDPYVALWNRIFWCREWVNLPVADLNAASFADELLSIADTLGVRCTVFDKKKIEALRMGGLLAVNKGSVDEPRFVVLEYDGTCGQSAAPIALVGKGIMYDTGGLNIKTGDYMSEMKSDMAGAATMASVLFAAADNHLPVHLVALLPLTDSRPGFNAYAPDDVITMYDGTTVEVVNTDAEGRIILADAIAYAVDKHQPRLLVDAATLTGAAVRAISTFGIAVMQQNAAEPMARMAEAGEACYERLAQFPFWKEYDKLIESEIADLKNCGPGQAGTITAGKFLAHFAKTTPYIHLDIAGVAYFSKPQPPFGFGASGYGVRMLYRFLQTEGK